MAQADPATDKSFEDNAPKQPEAPKGNTDNGENSKAAPEAPKKTTGEKADKTTKPTEDVDKSFQDDKKKSNKKIKVGDRVSYPYRDGENGKRTSKVYEVTDSTVTILGYDGQKTTVGLDRVDLV